MNFFVVFCLLSYQSRLSQPPSNVSINRNDHTMQSPPQQSTTANQLALIYTMHMSQQQATTTIANKEEVEDLTLKDSEEDEIAGSKPSKFIVE